MYAVVPILLPSADLVRTRSSSDDKKSKTIQPAEWRGVSALSGVDLNVADLSMSPKLCKRAVPHDEGTRETPVAALEQIPVVLPSAHVKLLNKEKGTNDTKLQQPLANNYFGISAQFADEYNHVTPDSPQVQRSSNEGDRARAPTEAKVEQPIEIVGTANLRDEQLPLPQIQRPSHQQRFHDVLSEPPVSYNGIAADIADEYNAPPSPTPQRRSRNNSEEVALPPASNQAGAYPFASEELFDEYKFDMAQLNAQKHAKQKRSSKDYSNFSSLSMPHIMGQEERLL